MPRCPTDQLDFSLPHSLSLSVPQLASQNDRLTRVYAVFDVKGISSSR